MTSATKTLDTHASSASDGHHGQAPERPSYDDINTPVVVLVGAISAIVTLLTIMFVQGMYYHWQNSFIHTRSSEVSSIPAVQQIEAQKELLAGGDGKTISIDKAMQSVVKKYGK